MVSYFGCLIIQRLLFPIILTACTIARPVALSIPYVFLLLWLPFVPVATPASMRKHTKAYFVSAIVLSVATCLAQIAFQVVMFTTPALPRCAQLEYLFRHLGFIPLYQFEYIRLLWFLPDAGMLIASVVLFVLLRALNQPLSQQVVDGVDQPLTAASANPAAIGQADDGNGGNGGAQHQQQQRNSSGATATSMTSQVLPSAEVLAMRKQFGTFVALVALLLVAAVRPSVPSAVYFVVFLGASTWWACFKELDRAFSVICRLVLVFAAAHFGTFLTYQTPWPQEMFPPGSPVVRYLGFDALIRYNCSSVPINNVVLEYNTDLPIDSWLNPFAILLCYYTLALTAGPILSSRLLVRSVASATAKRAGDEFASIENGGSGTTVATTVDHQHRLSRQVSLRVRRKTIVRKAAARDTWQEAADKVRARRISLAAVTSSAGPTERTPLMHRGGKKFGSFKPKKTRTGDNVELDELCNETRSNVDAEPPPSIREQLIYGLGQVNDFVFKNSYILSNIILMVWSIVFHSWITFVLLLWANLLWVIPNQRKHMMRSSPFIVVYAELLLLAQFLFNLNLTEDELPSARLDQIGFVRDKEYPAISILLKTLFTCVFWVTMRQFFYEREIARQSSALAHLAAPFQVTVSAATSDMGPTPTNKKSKIINRLGTFVKQCLLQLWIWIVVLALFCCAIYGQRMTAFRITYMALFLVFVITFQMSWRVWTKLMYAYWVIVIGFAMCTLVMIYTYQFEGFTDYWTKYMGISETLQQDMGLERYETKDLFLHLLYPTLVVIITVVQLQIFHAKYLNLMKFTMINQRDISSESGMIPPSSINYGSIGGEEDVKSTATRRRSFRYFKMTDFKKVNSKNIMEFLGKQYDNIKWFIEVFWLLVEMHSTKLILIYSFYLGCKEVSVLHISIIVLACIACGSRSHLQAVISRIISLVIGLLLIAKMIYQIHAIDQKEMDVHCNAANTTSFNETVNDPSNNTGNWIGLYKGTPSLTFPTMIHGYIVYLVLVTLYTIVCLRLKRHRFLTGKPMTRPKIIFPEISRDLADKCLGNMLKYLANFVFFKFGIELTFIMLVVLIGQRMDFVALIYVGWLLVLFRADPTCRKRSWPYFRVFIIALTLLQYVVAVGIPPFLCVDYAPVDSVYWQPLQEWAWLPDKSLRDQSEMLMLDFVLLMFVCRQMLVFRIEQQYSAAEHEFPGGSNKSVVEDIHNMAAVPVAQAHDFTTSIRCWLDIVKCTVFIGCYWTSLAIVFLAGTNRVSIFSIGYLVGSFIFLWQGTEFYLRPIHTIIAWWKYLICYNLFVIGTKVLLQIPGCIFAVNLQQACWLTQLLGISCIRKYAAVPVMPGIDPPEGCEIGEDVGLAWDGLCFAILVFQLRIYQSYYFTHIINESKAITILSSRGAELIEELRRKEVKLQARREADILQKIKLKMDRIKANQRKLQPAITHPRLHPEEEEPQQRAPLARDPSMSSCTGYHTPIEDEFGEAISDLPSDLGGRGTSFLSTQAPSPMSAILTVSLDGYLDDKRMSYGSPPDSDLTVDSYPVFSPVPSFRREYHHNATEEEAEPQALPASTLVVPHAMIITTTPSTTSTTAASAASITSPLLPASALAGAAASQQQQNTLQPGGVQMRQHRRQSSINTVSWTDQGDSSSIRPLSYNLDPASDDADNGVPPSTPAPQPAVSLRRRPSHRRQSSVAISWNRFQDPQPPATSGSRRESAASWMRDGDYDEVSTRTGRSGVGRPCSWGPVGEFYYRESLCLSETDRSLFSHHECDAWKRIVQKMRNNRVEAVRSGDYYLFEDLGEKIELDLMTAKSPPVVSDVQLRQRLASKQTVEQVLAQKLARQRSSQISSSEMAAMRRPSLPEEHASGVDPRSTSSDPVRGGRGCGSVSQQMHHDEFVQADGQRAGTSRDAISQSPPAEQPSPVDERDGSQCSDSTDKELSGIAFVIAFLSGMLVTVTLRLYKLSRNYRYVMRVLAREKQEMKGREDFGKGHRVGAGNVWSPMPSAYGRVHDTHPAQPSGSSTSVESVTQPICDQASGSGAAATSAPGAARPLSAVVEIEAAQERPGIANLLRPGMFTASREPAKAPEDEASAQMVPAIRIVAASIDGELDDDLVDGKFDDLKYDSEPDASSVSSAESSKLEIKSHDDDDFYSRDHSMATEFVTALWYAIISNTDLLCYLLVFLNMVASASLLAMPIPIMVFLWGTMTVSRPSKTFWVTLIAYTQVVVLIKCVCQLHVVWWNTDPVPTTTPLAPARIIGIEKNPNYADYDLALLLVIFFHRFVQKQMGIWRSVPDEEEEVGGEESGQQVQVQQQPSPPPPAAPQQQQPRSEDAAKMDADNGDISGALLEEQPLTLAHSTGIESDETLDSIEGGQNGAGETSNYLQNVAALSDFSTKKYCSSFTKFFRKLLLQVNRVTVDLYVYIFLCDFINFFVLLFGFTAFGSTQGDGGVAAYVEENKIPVAFLIMLLLQFVFIIVDRALYLRKNLAGKIVFQFVTVIAMHVWLFFLVPMSSEKNFNARSPPVIFYIVKCFYFLFSAHQIRCGYPRRILGNCLTKGFSMLNLGAFKVYMLTPFLFELRALMDWIWTDTSMPLFEWLKMEDVFANIYELKCSRQMEQDFPAQRGEPKKAFIKYLMGGGFLFVLIAIVWGPLALFAWGNTVGTTNIPYEVKVELSLGSFEPVYTSKANHIIPFTEDRWDTMKRQFNKNRAALTFLSSFESDDVAAVQLGPNSKALWLISPPDLNVLIDELKRNETMHIKYVYSVSRKTYSDKMLGTISAEAAYDLANDDPARQNLIDMLDPDAAANTPPPTPNAAITTNNTTAPFAPVAPTVLLLNLFPKFLKVKNLGDLKTISQMFPPGATNYRNITLQLHRTARGDLYWEMLEACNDEFYEKTLKKLPYANCTDHLVLYTVSDKLFPPTLSWLTAGGVIGIYSTFVFIASRFFRTLFSGASKQIMYSEMPYVDRILQLCLDIYLVRESQEFALEEDLFAKLIFLYRSPETMIKWTRPAEEQTDDDATEADASAGEDDDDGPPPPMAPLAIRAAATKPGHSSEV